MPEVAPERLGLCGAYNWLDGKASFEINANEVRFLGGNSNIESNGNSRAAGVNELEEVTADEIPF